MVSEAIRRASRGEDVAIGVVDTHGRKAVTELAGKLERIPPRRLEFKGTVFEELDVDAILARKPSVVLVDELAHTNIEGSRHSKRFEDVMDLLGAGIDVLSTMNVQHIESLGPSVLQIKRRAGPRNSPGLGDAARRRDPPGRPDASSLEGAYVAGRHLPHGPCRTGSFSLLQARQSDCTP